MKALRYLAMITTLGVSAAACTALHEDDRTITLSGEIIYDAYQNGTIRVLVCESESSSYKGGGQTIVQTPGDCVAETTLSAPGAFSVKADFSWAKGNEPNAEILVYLVADESSELQSCTAGNYVSQSADSDSDIKIILKDGFCPMRD